MKAKSIATAVLVSIFINHYSQDPEWEETPWGTSVLTYINQEMDWQKRRDADEYYEIHFPDVEFLPTYGQYSSTNRFNCHGWAWYMSEPAEGTGTLDERWINTTNGTLPYITDGISYKIVDEIEADIVWWDGGNHSALTTDVYREWTSKWYTGPLVKHDWDDSPFGTSDLVFYKRCFYRLTAVFSEDDTMEHCKVQFLNSSVSSNVDLEVIFEDWVQIEGTFSTGTGATLSIHPNN